MPDTSPFLLQVVFAFAGGTLLNLMPCVFPMLAVKLLALTRSGSEGASPRGVRLAGLAYTAGVVVSFLGFLAVLLLLRASGRHLGWGFQLQEPFFVAGLVALFFLMTLVLSGVFDISWTARFLPGRLSAKASGAGPSADFFAGLLAVALASPCTAPLMAPALGFALAQSPVQAAGIFVSLGLGFASPFLALSVFPAAARRLPRPGPWMDTFKQALVFPLIGTQIWLGWLFAKLAGVDALAWLLAGLLALGFTLWALGRSSSSRAFRGVGAGIGIAMMAVFWTSLTPSAQSSEPRRETAAQGLSWKAWSSEAVREGLAAGKTVFVDFTADWCVTCKVNEKTALESDRVRGFLASPEGADVLMLKADWTNEDEAISRELERFGRAGVPLYLVYANGNEDPTVLPQILTPEIVHTALSGKTR